MTKLDRKQLYPGALNVSKKLFKELALAGEREEWTARARHVVKNGVYTGRTKKGHLFEGEGLLVQLDTELRKIVSLQTADAPKAPKNEQSFTYTLLQSASVMQKALQDITASAEQLSEQVSQIDKEISHLYHEIETAALDTEQGYQYAVKLQGLLRKRRVIKKEYGTFQAITDELDLLNKNIEVVRQKTMRVKGNK